MNTEACVVKKELDEIEEVAELFLEKLQKALKIEKNSSRCFLIDFFFCFRIFSIWFCIHVKYYCLYNSFLLLEKKNCIPFWEASAEIRLEGLGSKALEDGSIHGREGPSDRRIQSHAAE